jgi:hypothetical protein
MKDRLHFALEIGLLGCVYGYLISMHSYSLQTTDWAAKGVPIIEQLWNEVVIHGLPGGIAGLIVGFFAGMVVPKSLIALFQGKHTERTLNPAAKFIIFLAMLLTVGLFFYFFDPTPLTVAINLSILIVLYMVGEHFLGEPEDKK